MKIALIAPPFIPVPPVEYGGTELFVAQLSAGLCKAGVEVVVYANGESTVQTPRRWLYPHSEWPIKVPERAYIRELNHTSWAIHDALRECDLIHVQPALGLTFSRFTQRPFVMTLHGPHEQYLSDYYANFPAVHYVCISKEQCSKESMPRLQTIHHGLDLTLYSLVETKQQYLSFIGRIAPMKGTHIAIEVAKRSGIPLKIAGEVQPINREYFDRKIRPHIDGKLVEYIGPADLKAKNELLGNSLAMLFPIQWSEPFGLVMLEAMACGTPVLALPGGSVAEVVQNGVSGYVCKNVPDIVRHAENLNLPPRQVRNYVQEFFSIEAMVAQYMSLYERALNEKPQRIGEMGSTVRFDRAIKI